MKKTNSAERLKELMNILDIKQTDIIEKTGIPKSAMSMYISGQRAPRQNRLSLIADAYNINEAWLMGYDVPMERSNFKTVFDSGDHSKPSYGVTLYGHDEQDLILNYRKLSSLGKEEAIKRVSELTLIPKYTLTTYEKYELEYTTSDLTGDAPIELQHHRSGTIVLPYFRGGISAGNGIFILGNEAEDEIEVPNISPYQDADYAIDVDGKSMEPDYMNDDVVFVKQDAEMQHGDIGVFIVNGAAFIKEWREHELISHNQTYPNIKIREGDNVVCMGKVIGKLED